MESKLEILQEARAEYERAVKKWEEDFDAIGDMLHAMGKYITALNDCQMQDKGD